MESISPTPMPSTTRPCVGADLGSRAPHGHPVVGVLGGMGPLATAQFLATLTQESEAAIDQHHLSSVIWCDPRIPDRTDALLGRGPDPRPWLVDGGRRLKKAGATMIAIPCNTAHAFLSGYVEAVGLPVVHMIEAAAEEVSSEHPICRKAGILATEGTIVTGLYQKVLQHRRIEPIAPCTAVQMQVSEAIRSIKFGNVEQGRCDLIDVCDRLRDDVDVVIAGCTEISLALHLIPVGVPVVDSLVALARAVISRAGHPRRVVD